MKTEITCANCGHHLGWYYEYPWGDYGQDPPEYVGVEDWVDDAGNYYCGEGCLSEALEKDEDEDE